jgi:hypothetical protein
MTAMRVIHTGPEHRPHVEPMFEGKAVVDVAIREGDLEHDYPPAAEAD